MTRAELLTAVLRAVYPDEAAKVQNAPGQWWLGYYNLALNYGLLYSGKLDDGAMDRPMNRQEMAMVLVRAMRLNGESISKLVAESQIADYSSIGAQYQMYVRECFSKGVICVVDSKCTFAPQKSLTRAEEATVLFRLGFADERVAVVFADETEGGLVLSGPGSGDTLKPGNSGGSSNPNATTINLMKTQSLRHPKIRKMNEIRFIRT